MHLSKGKKNSAFGLGLIVILFILYLVASMIAGPSQAKIYQVKAQDDTLEVRNYNDVLLAQVELEGTRKDTLKRGQDILMSFFEGANSFNYEIDVHAPIFQQEHPRNENQWIISMLLPEKYQGEDLPKPEDEQIKIIRQPAQSYAVLEFCGLYSDANINQNYELLKSHLKRSKTIPKSKPIIAYYSPSWAFPWVRTIDIATFVPKDFELAQQ